MKRILLLSLTISVVCNAKSSIAAGPASASASASEGDVKMTDVESAGRARGTKRKAPAPETEEASKEGDTTMGDAENPYAVSKKAKKTGWQAVLPPSEPEGDVKMVEAKPTNKLPQELEKEIANALEARDFATLEKIVKGNPAIVNMLDSDGNNLLMVTLMQKHLIPDPVIRDLITLTKNVNYRNRWGQTALMFAARNGMANAVEQLLKSGASPDARDDDGENPLMEAMEQQNPQVVMMLLKRGVNVKDVNSIGETALHKAIHWAVPPEQKKSEKCEICKRAHSPSPEHQAKTVEILLEKGAHINAATTDDEDSITPLLRAIKYGNVPVVQMLISKGAGFDMIPGNFDSDPVSLAASQRGRHRMTKEKDPLTAQERALSEEAYLQIIKLLLDAGANPQEALNEAAQTPDAKVVELLLMRGAAPDANVVAAFNMQMKDLGKPGFRPDTPAIRQEFAHINTLLKNPATIKAMRDEREIWQKAQAATAQAAMEHRILQGQPEIAESILEFIGEPNTKPGQTTEQVRNINYIKHALAKNKNAPLAELFKDPEKLELVDDDGNTPLLLALHYQKQEKAAPYTKSGTNALNIIITALEAADKKEEGKMHRLKRALEHKDRQGYDALGLARALKLSKEVIERLESEKKSVGE